MNKFILCACMIYQRFVLCLPYLRQGIERPSSTCLRYVWHSPPSGGSWSVVVEKHLAIPSDEHSKGWLRGVSEITYAWIIQTDTWHTIIWTFISAKNETRNATSTFIFDILEKRYIFSPLLQKVILESCRMRRVVQKIQCVLYFLYILLLVSDKNPKIYWNMLYIFESG